MKNTRLKAAIAFALVSTVLAAPAYAAPTIFDQIRTITSNLGAVKDLAIYGAFLAGLGALIWGGMDMIKKSKDRGGDDISWSGIGIKFLAAALLISVTVTSDVMKNTFLGGSTSVSSTSNFN